MVDVYNPDNFDYYGNLIPENESESDMEKEEERLFEETQSEHTNQISDINEEDSSSSSPPSLSHTDQSKPSSNKKKPKKKSNKSSKFSELSQSMQSTTSYGKSKSMQSKIKKYCTIPHRFLDTKSADKIRGWCKKYDNYILGIGNTHYPNTSQMFYTMEEPARECHKSNPKEWKTKEDRSKSFALLFYNCTSCPAFNKPSSDKKDQKNEESEEKKQQSESDENSEDDANHDNNDDDDKDDDSLKVESKHSKKDKKKKNEKQSDKEDEEDKEEQKTDEDGDKEKDEQVTDKKKEKTLKHPKKPKKLKKPSITSIEDMFPYYSEEVCQAIRSRYEERKSLLIIKKWDEEDPIVLESKDLSSIFDSSETFHKFLSITFNDPLLQPYDHPLEDIMRNPNPEFIYFYSSSSVLIPRYNGYYDRPMTYDTKGDADLIWRFLNDPELASRGLCFDVARSDRPDIVSPSILDMKEDKQYKYRLAEEWFDRHSTSS